MTYIEMGQNITVAGFCDNITSIDMYYNAYLSRKNTKDVTIMCSDGSHFMKSFSSILQISFISLLLALATLVNI